MSPRGFTTGLAELVLIVEDVPRAADFYREVVGLEPESPADEEWAWFFAGATDRSQRIALRKGSLLFEEHSPHPEGHRFGKLHFALDVPRDRLDEPWHTLGRPQRSTGRPVSTGCRRRRTTSTTRMGRTRL